MSTQIFPPESKDGPDQVGGLSINSFFGGAERGICLQFTIYNATGTAYAQLNRAQVEALTKTLVDWRDNNPFKPTGTNPSIVDPDEKTRR